MIESLLNRRVEKRGSQVQLEGHILFLTEDPALVRSQLEGIDLDPANIPPLRNDISTDEMTPAYICYYFDETLGEFIYLGLKCGDQFPIRRNDVKNGGFIVSVSGKRRGKGSSREASPYAEIAAGIRLVIAENHERIYKQNCQNLGLLTSTNFDLIRRVAAGDSIPLEEFMAGEDEITRQIIEYGGLFPFNVARLQGKVAISPIITGRRPMTLAEKIFARHFVTDLSKDRVGVDAVKPGDAGFVRTDIRFSHEYVTPMAAIFYEKLVGDEPINDPSSVYLFQDHLTFLDDVMPPERKAMGLLELAHELVRKQEAFSTSWAVTTRPCPTSRGTGCIGRSSIARAWRASVTAGSCRTMRCPVKSSSDRTHILRTPARSVRSRLELAPPTYSTRGSQKTFAFGCPSRSAFGSRAASPTISPQKTSCSRFFGPTSFATATRSAKSSNTPAKRSPI